MEMARLPLPPNPPVVTVDTPTQVPTENEKRDPPKKTTVPTQEETPPPTETVDASVSDTVVAKQEEREQAPPKFEPEPVQQEPIEQEPIEQETEQETEQQETPATTPPNSQTPQPTTLPQVEIIAGKTAPSYSVRTPELCQYLVSRHNGRYLVTDGIIFVSLGRSLNTSNMEQIGSEWHEQYADRMVQVPELGKVNSAIRAASAKYKLGPNARCYVSVGHRLDREIFKAQQDYFEDQMDVTATTVIDFVQGRPRVVGLLAPPARPTSSPATSNPTHPTHPTNNFR